MNVEITIGTSFPAQASYLAWTPRLATARINAGTPGSTVAVTLQNSGPGGRIVFGPDPASVTQDSLSVPLAGDGKPSSFYVAGKFGFPSSADGDAIIQAADATAAPLGQLALMVRIRKDAQTLTAAERDRFLSALATLNNRGMGRFSDFRDMHTMLAYYEAHGNTGFTAWHRTYILDLERFLQSIDRSVALPYWRFDQPAPQLFTLGFMGVPNHNGTVQFSPGHPLQSWVTDSAPGISRKNAYGASIPMGSQGQGIYNEAQTLALGDDFGAFQYIESDPHNLVHSSFGGFLSDPTIAPRDPLFFLLHANVDRLWAKWQWLKKLSDPGNSDAYANPNPSRIGHHLDDTMWPWNGITGNGQQPTPTGDNRPPTAPGGALPQPADVTFPPPSPMVRDMLDYQGIVTLTDRMGFGYDDVPFEA